MKKTITRFLPGPVFNLLKIAYNPLRDFRHRHLGLPRREGETSKARPRRLREGFFEKFCRGKGLDIGYGGDLLAENCRGWDFLHGDAQYLKTLGDSQFDFVYSSHALEHLVDPEIALQNWWRVVKNNGYLIVYIPHRDLYEKKKTLPSRWNSDHKHFFLPETDEAPDTIGVIPLLNRALSNFEIIYIKECSEAHTITDPKVHSDGEYSIEFVLLKSL